LQRILSLTLKKRAQNDPRQRIIRHLFLPSVAPAALTWFYFTPKSVFGCANRGYMALAVVSLALVAAVATAIKGITARKRGENKAANWWTLTSLILVSPLALLVGPFG
jgi:hypothetical protein